MKTIKDLKNVKGQVALVRVDYNVPLKGTRILDARRIEASFETILALQKKGMTVRLMAHLGDGQESLKPIANYLAKHLKVVFIKTALTDKDKLEKELAKVPKGSVALFENIRAYEGEEKNDKAFSKLLASLGDVFVNDAFSVCHRKHASVVGVAKYLPSYAGIQLEKEIKTLSKLLDNKKHPFVFMLGGAKFGTKIPLIKRFLDNTDQIAISGAIANSFFKTAGFEIGKSVTEAGYEKIIKTLIKSPKLLLPVDVIVLRGNKKQTLLLSEIQKDDIIVDIGPQSVTMTCLKIQKAKVVVWNGPTGWYEKGFTGATVTIAKAIEASKAFAVIGGGDTGAVVEKTIGKSKHIFISTGGGATLDFLAKGTLVGVQCL